MAQIQSPETYVDGQQVTAARLNNQTNGATLLPGAISDQSALTANTVDSADSIILYDVSSSALRKATISDLLNSGLSSTTGVITGKTGVNVTITPATGQKAQIVGNLDVTGNETITGTLTVTGNTTLNADVTVTGIPTFNTTAALKLPVGTTAQRPGTGITGQVRYNTTISKAEVYNGTTWEVVGGGPFDATGGNKIIAPDAAGTTPVTASFTCTDGFSIIVTSSGHTVVAGQVVKLTTSVTGYSGTWTCYSVTSTTFTVIMPVAASPNSGSCTYNKAGNFKIHIFTSSGTFNAATVSAGVEVFVVGGGAGGVSSGFGGTGGGGGAVVYNPYYYIAASSTISVTVGSGGAAATNGSSSVFGPISAGGGLTGNSTSGGASGSGSLDAVSNAGATYSSYLAGGGNYSNGGGGGGAGAAAQYSSSGTTQTGGGGGAGKGSSISGLPVNYGGGGAGGNGNKGGVDGGGANYTAASANTGGGGGSGAAGGSGIVIIRYPTW